MRPLFRSLFLVLLLGTALVPQARADQLDDMQEQIDRLIADLADLREQFYSGSSGGTTGAAGPNLELRMQAFEQELRNLTGMVEQVSYQQNQLAQRLDKLQADVEFRLQTLEGGGQVGAVPPASGSVAEAPTPVPGTGPQVLGTVTEEELQSVAGGATGSESVPTQTAGVPAGTPQEQYDYAFGLLRQANYDGAEVALKDFIAKNPTDPLVANAKYWLGETYYVRGMYAEAAQAFGVAYQDHPDGPKAPDNLLKLGLSLSLLGKGGDACTVLAELETRFPNASANLLQRSKQERERLSCS